jgi:hypothetical protein
MTGAHRSAVPEMSRAHMAALYDTTSLAPSDHHPSPVRAERGIQSQTYQSFLPTAMLNPHQNHNHQPSRALSLNRSQHLTLQPQNSSSTHSASPTAGMFLDLFWKTQNRGPINSADTPDLHSRSPASRGIRSPSRTGLLTPGSADGKTRQFDGGYRRPDAPVGFLAPLTP